MLQLRIPPTPPARSQGMVSDLQELLWLCLLLRLRRRSPAVLAEKLRLRSGSVADYYILLLWAMRA